MISLAWLISVLPAQAKVVQENLRFGNLGIQDGLSQSSLYCGFQDQRGFLWFGTEDGLNRYDGYDFKVFYHDPLDTNSLSYNWISSLSEDGEGSLWIGTFGQGLNRIDYLTGDFTRIYPEPGNEKTLTDGNIQALYRGQDGFLWIATATGLARLDTGTQEFKNYTWPVPEAADRAAGITSIVAHGPQELWLGSPELGLGLFDLETGQCRWTRTPAGMTAGPDGRPIINCILQTAGKELWLGTDNGIWAFDNRTETFLGGPVDENGEPAFHDRNITAMVEDMHGDRWVGTDDGLVRYDGETKGFFLIRSRAGGTRELRDNAVMSLMVDRSHVLWVGTGLGLSYLDLELKEFQGYTPNPLDPHSLSDVFVRGFLEEPDGNLWVATWGGLNYWNRQTGQFKTVPVDPARDPADGPDLIYSLEWDTHDRLIVATDDGAFRRERDGEPFARLGWVDGKTENVIANPVRVVYRDHAGDIWLGTPDGLNRMDRSTGEITTYRHDADSEAAGPCADFIYALYEDSRFNLWVGTTNGLSRLDPRRETFHNYHPSPGRNTGLNTHEALSITELDDGQIWVGTPSGINCLDPDTETFTVLTTNDGLPNNTIYAMVQDRERRVWLTTNNGIACLDNLTGDVRTFDHTDGLMSDEFNLGSALSLSSGEIAFGGIGGFDIFDPDRIRENAIAPSPAFTDFKVFNESIRINGRKPLSTLGGSAPDITVSYRDYVLRFEFAAMHFVAPGHNRYATKLEGADADWVEIGTQRFVAYNNLPPGDYVLHVKAANHDGVWSSEEISARLHITPPFWQRAWFKGLGIVLMLTVIWGSYRYRTRLMRFKSQELERNVKKRTIELQQEISERVDIERALKISRREAVCAAEAKSTFLATMSHEIRTPMNGVIGMSQLVLESSRLCPEDREQIETIQTSGESLLTIINDILDFSKIEAGKMEIETAPFDLQTACHEVADLLAPKAGGKGLELAVRYAPGTPRRVVGDGCRVRQILLNLVGNAIKFTNEGHVLIEVTACILPDGAGGIRISIQDTGIGLSEEDCGHLFQPFSQADSSTTRRFGGTGLGLAICKQLAELMGGRIGVDSAEGKGSNFWCTLNLAAAEPDVNAPAPTLPAGTRVLVVDKCPTSANILSEMLLGWGSQPTVAGNEQEAAHELATSLAGDNPYATVIVSGRAGQGDGEILAELLAGEAERRRPPLLLLAPPSQALHEDRLQAAGFAGVIVKPPRPGDLKAALLITCSSAPDTPAGQQEFINRRLLSRQRAERQASATGQAGSDRTPTVVGDCRVLVAEDNPVNQKVAQRMLERAGCQVDLASDGREAVEMWQRGDYRIIFMDCRMPEMDGYTATREIRKLETGGSRVPIVAMTANVMDGDEEKCLAAGMDDYLPKPLKIASCHEALARWADSGAREPEPVG